MVFGCTIFGNCASWQHGFQPVVLKENDCDWQECEHRTGVPTDLKGLSFEFSDRNTLEYVLQLESGPTVSHRDS